jgi:hypothetical protein
MDLPPDALALLFRGDTLFLRHDSDGRFHSDAPLPRALLCGSFNPLHDGHRGLAEVATRRLGCPVEFELGVLNADKSPLTVAETQRRLRQFVDVAPVWLTAAPTFAAKARLFPGATFVVGADTAERIIDPRFYGNGADLMLMALDEMRMAGCRFLVAGRVRRTGGFIAAEALELPLAVRDMFECISSSEFRYDLSSTQLRGS